MITNKIYKEDLQMRKKFNKRFKGFKAKKEGLTIEKHEFPSGTPEKPTMTGDSEELQQVAFRDLAFKGAIEVAADVNTPAAKGSYPYRLVNRTNKIVDAKYPGIGNILGNAITRIQNSDRSQFMNVFDSVCMAKTINYLYMANTPDDPNIAYNYELVKAFDEGLSNGYSTMLTQLPFFTDVITTGLPEIEGQTPLHDSYSKMGALIHYQAVLQNIVAPIAKYVEIRSEEGELKDMSYRREATTINELYGLLKKSAFISKLQGIGTSIIGEYFDKNWWTQLNALRHLPSRKTNSMNDPLITMVSNTYVPHLTMRVPSAQTPYYDSDVILKSSGNYYRKLVSGGADVLVYVEPETFSYIEVPTGGLTLTQIVMNINKLLDPHYILHWARLRLNYANKLNGMDKVNNSTAYYNALCNYLDMLAEIATRFSSYMSDIRTFLDKVSNTGMLYWEKGLTFDINSIKDIELQYNQLTADTLKITLSGADRLHFDETTQRWKCYTAWDLYTGVAKFDGYSGGAFLSMSLRSVEDTYTDSENHEQTIPQNSSTRIIPCLFRILVDETAQRDATSAYVSILSRNGIKADLITTSLNSGEFSNNPTLSRLNPLDVSDIHIKIPNWDYSKLIADYQLTPAAVKHMSAQLIKTLCQITDICGVTYATNSKMYNCSPDILCYIDVELTDVTNAMIQYARNYNPFRVSTPDGKRSMGFGSK